MLPGKGLCGARRETVYARNEIGCLLIEIVVSQAGRVHACIGYEKALQAIEDDEKWLAVEDGEQLRFLLWSREFLDLLPGLPGHICQGARDEVFERGIALVKTPPHPTCKGFHLLGSNVIEPLPGKGALAHAADSDNVEDAGTVDIRSGRSHPIGQQVQFDLASNQR